MRTRFAPSPTGLLHIGNAYSALTCQAWAKKYQAAFILRIEDIDFTRCKPEFSVQMIDDLNWLGISFTGEISYQQQRLFLYQQALDTLINMDVLYPCFCTRKQIETQLSQINHKHHLCQRLDNYPSTCKTLSIQMQKEKMLNQAFAWRLNMQTVIQMFGQQLSWFDSEGLQQKFGLANIGDVIIGRKDIRYSYHLAVVVDDAEQNISHVIRGQDLQSSTGVHIVLQKLLNYSSPYYHHHQLIADEQGGRLAKSRKSITLKSLRDSAIKAESLRQQLGF